MNVHIKPLFVKDYIFLSLAERKKVFLGIECATLFVFLPILMYIYRHDIAFKLIPLLVIASVLCCAYLLKNNELVLHKLLYSNRVHDHLKQIIVSFLPIALLMTIFTYFFVNNRFFVFPIAKPGACWMFILIYPILSALPQEIIFKSFFFHRYRSLFPTDKAIIIFNGLCFGLAHLWYANMIAPVISAFGGMLLAYRYLKTNSLLMVSIEHSIWGIFIYCIGLGWYFYSGSIQ
ncbi:MAG: CPBP family intramembrane metalloprotease [Desulfobacterales bacterium]|nr:CPBP family intramembrane metalloprotease [Desulfobacterales bacterium]